MSQSPNFAVGDGCTCRRPNTTAQALLNFVLKLFQQHASGVDSSVGLTRQGRTVPGLDDRLLDGTGLPRSEIEVPRGETKSEGETKFWRSYARRHLK